MNALRGSGVLAACVTVVAVGVAVIVALSGGVPPEAPPVARYGLAESTIHRWHVTGAAAICNQVLSDRHGIGLEPSWLDPPNGGRPTVIPVYLAGGSGLKSTQICFVPEDRLCVVVNDRHLPDVYAQLGRDKPGESRPELQNVLAIMLLHEVGHIVHGDPGSHGPTSSAALNVAATGSTERELRADRFAGTEIRDAVMSNARFGEKGFDRYLAAARLRMACQMIGFELLGRRLIDDFGSTALSAPSAFYDHSYTHPNMELRFMHIDDVVQPTAEKQARTDQFLNARQPQPPVRLYP